MSAVSGTPLDAEAKRVLVLCGNDAPSITAANVYAELLHDRDVRILEERIVSPRRILNFSRRRLRAKGILSLLDSFLYYGARFVAPGVKPQRRYRTELTTDDFNSDPAVAAFIGRFDPDVVLVGFCGLLGRELLRILPSRVYNTHPGINPRYRGFGNIWALSEDNPDCVGYTIHKVDEGADTGERIAVQKFAPQELSGVAFIDMDVPAADMAARRMAGILLGREEGGVPETFRDLPSRFYGVPTFSAFLRARKNFQKTRRRPPRNILITGASSGLGGALAEEYAAPGTRLILWARDLARLEATAALCRAKGAETVVVSRDVRDLEESRRLLETLDAERPLDLAVLGAGVSSGTLPGGEPESAEDACRTITVNALAAINMAGTLCGRMAARKHGRVAVLSSIAALYPLPDSPAYSAAKAALAYYARGVRPSFPGVGISVVYPGYVDTPMSRRLSGPQPMRWSAAKAAAHIRERLDSGAETIVFPRLLAAGTWLLNLPPAWIANFFLKRFGFSIEPDGERSAKREGPHG